MVVLVVALGRHVWNLRREGLRERAPFFVDPPLPTTTRIYRHVSVLKRTPADKDKRIEEEGGLQPAVSRHIRPDSMRLGVTCPHAYDKSPLCTRPSYSDTFSKRAIAFST